MSGQLIVSSDGPEVVASNYWDAPEGEYIVSVNAGAFRVLLAPRAEGHLAEMRTAKGAAVSRGKWPAAGKADAYEVLFDDGSDAPFALHTSPEGFDRHLPAAEAGRRCVLSVWVRGPRKVLELPCTYRLARRIPDLRPWEVS